MGLKWSHMYIFDTIWKSLRSIELVRRLQTGTSCVYSFANFNDACAGLMQLSTSPPITPSLSLRHSWNQKYQIGIHQLHSRVCTLHFERGNYSENSTLKLPDDSLRHLLLLSLHLFLLLLFNAYSVTPQPTLFMAARRLLYVYPTPALSLSPCSCMGCGLGSSAHYGFALVATPSLPTPFSPSLL